MPVTDSRQLSLPERLKVARATGSSMEFSPGGVAELILLCNAAERHRREALRLEAELARERAETARRGSEIARIRTDLARTAAVLALATAVALAVLFVVP